MTICRKSRSHSSHFNYFKCATYYRSTITNNSSEHFRLKFSFAAKPPVRVPSNRRRQANVSSPGAADQLAGDGQVRLVPARLARSCDIAFVRHKLRQPLASVALKSAKAALRRALLNRPNPFSPADDAFLPATYRLLEYPDTSIY